MILDWLIVLGVLAFALWPHDDGGFNDWKWKELDRLGVTHLIRW